MHELGALVVQGFGGQAPAGRRRGHAKIMIAQPPGPRHFVVLTSARPVPYVLEASDRSALLRTTLATCLLGGAVGCGGAGLDPDVPPVTGVVLEK